MTDDEIIEGLECCFKNRKPCKKCPFYNMEQCNELLVGEFVYNLINRQRAEIKQKNTEIDILIRKNETLKDEVLELQTVKSEIIKEIAARLRKYIKWDINNDVYIKGADVDKVLNAFCSYGELKDENNK